MNFQDNINQNYEQAPEYIYESIRVLPFIMYHEYKKYLHLENSNKVIAPMSLLYKMSNYENINYPIKFKINGHQFVFSIFEFKEDIDEFYIPNHIIDQYSINIDNLQDIVIINKELVKGTSINIKPHTQDYLKIPDIKVYLEATLKNLYTCIFKNQTLRLPYLDGSIYFDITNINNYGDDVEIEDPIDIIDVDLEVVIEPSYLYTSHNQKEESENLVMNVDNTDDLLDEISDDENQEFVPFSGSGFKLGSS